MPLTHATRASFTWRYIVENSLYDVSGIDTDFGWGFYPDAAASEALVDTIHLYESKQGARMGPARNQTDV